MSALVVDASVASKWVIPEPETDLAEAILAGRHRLIAPDLVLIEVASAISKQVGAASLSLPRAQALVEHVSGFFDRLMPSAPLLPAALSLARELNHQIYDCVYIALALREEAQVVTADASLLRKISNTTFASRVIALASI